MRSCFAMACCILTIAALAQTTSTTKLGEPFFVSKGVEDVYWSPDGKGLLYTSQSKKGLILGVYDCKTQESQTLRHLRTKESIDQVGWLPNSLKAVVVLRTSLEQQTVTILAIDATTLSSKELWTRTFEKNHVASILLDVSPLLTHALVTVATEKSNETYVVTNGGSGIVYSRDIASAKEQNLMFSGWSKEGTALFGPANHSSQLVFRTDESSQSLDKAQISGTLEFTLTTDETPGKTAIPIKLSGDLPLIFRAVPSLKTGDTALECVPTNGALRSIRFSGFFQSSAEVKPWYQAELQLDTLKHEPVQSLWLMDLLAQPAHSNRPLPERKGRLVSAQADKFWISRDAAAIAFAWNGALFVRSISR